MCDASGEIDELIEFELTRDSDYIETEDEFQEEIVILEAKVDEEDDEEYLDTKPIMLETLDEYETVADYGDEIEETEEIEAEMIGIDAEPVDYLIEEVKPNIDELDNEMTEMENDTEIVISEVPTSKSSSARLTKGPKRYLLFDELVATIVDYDHDNTPIVEFSLSNADEDEKLQVECGICPDVMHKSKLGKHLKSHLVLGTNRYACIYCEESYKDPKYLAGHARRHMGIRPYVCEICKLYFSTKQDLRVHNQRRHHAKELICEICGKTFSQNTMLKRHREATHEKKRRFQCEHCPKAYYKNFSLQEHVRSVHLGKRRTLVCPFCGMQCRDAHKMARHRKQYHLNQTHFECNICQEEFTDINYFDAHKRSIQCRNNTRRKMEEAEEQMQMQNTEGLVYEITIPSNENI